MFLRYLLMSLFSLMPSLGAAVTVQLEHACIGFYAVNISTGEEKASHQSEISMMPLSCTKLITTGAALHLLGPEMRVQTTLEWDGKNLLIKGNGDPTLGSGRGSALTWKKQVEVWVDAVQAAGITSIEGTVIGDASAWELDRAIPSWAWEDIGNYYGAGASALSFNENSTTLYFKPDNKVGGAALLARTEPPLPSDMFRNEVTTGPVSSGDKACVYGMETVPFQILRGTIPAGVAEFSIRGALPDPARFCAESLAAELRRRGVSVGEKPLASTQAHKMIHTTQSPTIAELVYWTNQKSINLYAEHLLKLMGMKVYGEGSTKAGLQAVANFWQGQGVNLDGFHQVDGSGLSRVGVTTAKMLVAVLTKMKQSPHFAPYWESLPSAPTGEGRAKSGSVTGSKAYAGYVNDVAYAILINNSFNLEARKKAIESFVTQLSEIHATH